MGNVVHVEKLKANPSVFVLESWCSEENLGGEETNLEHRAAAGGAPSEPVFLMFQSHPADPDLITRPFSKHCGSGNMELWLTAAFGFKAPLLVSERRRPRACCFRHAG